MRTKSLLICGLYFLAAMSTIADVFLSKSSIRCSIKSLNIHEQRGLLGTNLVFMMTATIELMNNDTHACEIDRDSLVVALNTVRLSDSNSIIWEINSPLNQYHYDPFDTVQRTYLNLPGKATNSFDITLTTLDAPMIQVNSRFFGNLQIYQLPSQMFGTLFTTVQGRVKGSNRNGSLLLQGASTFKIMTQTNRMKFKNSTRK